MITAPSRNVNSSNIQLAISAVLVIIFYIVLRGYYNAISVFNVGITEGGIIPSTQKKEKLSLKNFKT
jgi:hypothetical protein